MKYLVGVIRVFVGLFFIISGFVKMVDPIGFSFKLEEYFSPSVFDLPFLMDYALFLAVFIVIAEVLMGIFLLLGIYTNKILFGLFSLIVFFTFLTFYSAYYDKVTDCGCFGEAMKLEPWESFTKDILLLLLVLILIIKRNYVLPFVPKRAALPIVLLAIVWCVFIPYRGIVGLPIIDFRPYKEGVNIKTELKKEGTPDIYSIFYQLENQETGEKVTVSDSVYMDEKKYWEKESQWVIKESKRKLLKKGTLPAVKDFIIDCGEEGDKTDEYLNMPYLVLFTSYGKTNFSKKGAEFLGDLVIDLTAMDLNVLSLYPEGKNEELDLPSCKMDATTLKTINRSNPGALLMHNGIIIKKYHWRQLPSAQGIADQFAGVLVNR